MLQSKLLLDPCLAGVHPFKHATNKFIFTAFALKYG